ncbi:hypothetical protein GGS26DRAFT_586111 [Hypomontagnella submonticulosa]|nr:hypothetical protein GGS26DRAFT_586111 [Hypomontagnella submonticulosa]
MAHFHGFSNMGDDWQKNASSLGYPNGFAQAAFNSSSTLGVINDLKFQTAKSIRTSTIILAAFNTVSAFATAAGILYDCYITAKRSKPEGKGRVNIFTCVRGPSTYPFVLSLGITIQGIIFAVSQSFGLKGFFIPSCSLISQFMWPAVFIVPYIQLVFGLEVTFRSLKSMPFPPRNKWNVPILLLVIKVLLGITGLVGVFIRPTNICFASLFWFVSKWAEGGFALLLIIVVILAICSIIIYLRLSRYSVIEDSERISASRMVYYLALAVLTNALIVPFFINLTFSNPMDDGGPGSTLSMISTVVANVTGLMTGGLHLFLRSNTIATIGPKNKLAEYERQKSKIEAGEGINDHILKPVPQPQSLSKTESQENLLSEKTNAAERGESPFAVKSLQFSPRNLNPLKSNAVIETASMPRVPEPAQVPTTSAVGHNRKPSASYTLFPNNSQGSTASVALLPSTAYNPNPQLNSNPTNFPFDDLNDTLRPPPSFRTPWGRHRRDSSMASSATVRIGLRISNVGDIGPMAGKASTEDESVYTLDCPQKDELGSTYRPSPLANLSASNTSAPQSPAQPRDSVTKTLPTAPAKPEEKKDCTLSPAVYDPNSPTKAKTPSPRGVGFNVPRRVNTTPVQGTSAQPTPRNRGNSSAAAGSRSDWI